MANTSEMTIIGTHEDGSKLKQVRPSAEASRTIKLMKACGYTKITSVYNGASDTEALIEIAMR